MNASVSRELLANLAADRSVFPHQYIVAGDQVLLVRLSPATQSQASFLDERVLAPSTQGAWFPADAIARAAAALPEKSAAYIFHAGHCGSTLVSRLIEAAADAAVLREPLPLRAFAFDAAEDGGALLDDGTRRARIALFEKLWARNSPAAVIKATSICTDLAKRLAPVGQAGAVFISQRPETQLAVLLAGENSANDLRGFASMRWRRLNAIAPLPPLARFGVGELAALAWLAESAAAHQAGLEIFDFDEVLKAPAETVKAIGAGLGVPLDSGRLAEAAAGPIMRRYSKAPEHAYDAAMRARIIAESCEKNRDEIRKGMKWLEHLAASTDIAAAVMARWNRA